MKVSTHADVSRSPKDWREVTYRTGPERGRNHLGKEQVATERFERPDDAP